MYVSVRFISIDFHCALLFCSFVSGVFWSKYGVSGSGSTRLYVLLLIRALLTLIDCCLVSFRSFPKSRFRPLSWLIWSCSFILGCVEWIDTHTHTRGYFLFIRFMCHLRRSLGNKYISPCWCDHSFCGITRQQLWDSQFGPGMAKPCRHILSQTCQSL